MTDNDRADDRCAVCAGALADRGRFCCFYLAGASVSLCGPQCAREYLRGPARSTAPRDEDLIREMVEEWRWTWGHGLRAEAPAANVEQYFASHAESASPENTKVVPQPKLSAPLSHENGACAY